jgi:glycosyltransferase involved in cell wall biosynthesis
MVVMSAAGLYDQSIMTQGQAASRHAFVIPAFGDSPFLTTCLESIAAQTQAGSEVFVTTSTPSDTLAGIAVRHNVPLEVNPRREGIGSDWNFALTATKATLVTLAHQDDAYRRDYVERMLAAMAEVPDALIAFSDYDETASSGPRGSHLNIRLKRYLCNRAFGHRPAIRDRDAKRRLLAWGNPICCPSVILNLAALPDFRFVEDLRSNLDWEAWLRLAELPGAFVYVREPLVTRRIHQQSETSALIADRRRLQEDRAMFERFWPAPIATLIMIVYRASYLANRT